MTRADLVATANGRPILVVEAKGSQVPEEYADLVRIQVSRLMQRTQARWLLLIDPSDVRLFRQGGGEAPIATLPTGDLLRDAGFGPETAPGEDVLLLAVERWLERLAADGRDAGADEPALRQLTKDLGQRPELAYDVNVA